jgi:hypothetical protein
MRYNGQRREGMKMKTLDEILDQFNPSVEWLDHPIAKPSEDDIDFGQWDD